jgi:MSHA biogenesis protein MshK
MDEAVKSSLERHAHPVMAAALAGLLAMFAAGAGAADHGGTSSSQGLHDPTRPPDAANPMPAAAPETKLEPQLQSVLVGPAAGAHRVAVIDGESVRVGERFHGARVVRIADNEVELERGRERQVLRLYAPDNTSGMTRVAPAAQRRDKGEQ